MGSDEKPGKKLKTGPHHLSKSKYVSGRQCLKLLWYTVRDPDAIPPVDAGTQFRFDQGEEAGKKARELAPDGVLIQAFPLHIAVQKTKEAIDRGEKIIFEAAFEHQDIHVKVDVLRNNGDGTVNITEVKSATEVKDYYYDDIAIQKYVVEGCGYSVGKSSIVHLNKEYVHPGDNLFVRVDVTDLTEAKQVDIPKYLEDQCNIIKIDEPPVIEIGPHCEKVRDNPCPLMSMCWKNIPELSVFSIPRIGSKKWELYKKGKIALDALPPDYCSGETQKPFIKSIRTGKPEINNAEIEKWLKKVVKPVYFMDFETIAYAVPRYDKTKPWQAIPIQWSVHKTHDGILTHDEFIYDTNEDPRRAFVETLIKALGGEGTILAWGAYEKTQLSVFLKAYPEYTSQLTNLIGRIIDFSQVFSKHYVDARCGGSHSLKCVLPVLVSGMSYDDLEIKEGDSASAKYCEMIISSDEKKEKIKDNLLKYCERDTYAMVKIYEIILNL